MSESKQPNKGKAPADQNPRSRSSSSKSSSQRRPRSKSPGGRRPSSDRGPQSRGRKDRNAGKPNLSVTKRGRTQHLRKHLDEGTYIAFDIETTGGNPEKNGITEIFAVRYQAGEIKDSFYSMVNPGVSIPPIVRRMTGITNKMVKDAPPIDAVMPGFVEFIKNDILVSHNTIGDMKFLRYFSEKTCGEMIDNYYLCTHLLVEKLAPQAPDKSLKGLASFFSIGSEDQLHRAEADAYLTLELFKKLKGRMLQNNIDQIVEAIRYQGDYESGMRLGWGIDSSVIDNLPTKAGVFYLYDRSNQVVFLSSAHNLQREVKKLQRLSLLPRQLLKAVLASTELHYDIAATPYAAALKEAEGIHKHKIKFDPANWHQRTANFLYVKADDDAFRIATGPLQDDVLLALGPIRGGREVTTLMEQLSRIFETKANKRGLKLEEKEGRIALDFLNGRAFDQSLLSKVKSLIDFRRPSPRLRAISDELSKLSIPLELNHLDACSGVMAVADGKDNTGDEDEVLPAQTHWHLYAVASGMPLEYLQLDGELIEAMKAKNLHIKLFKKIKLSIFKRRRKLEPLDHKSSLYINRIFWWAFFGERHESIRLLPVEELPKL